MSDKSINLQPWIEYFKMLQSYERNGYLEVVPGSHEALVTQAALLTLVNTDGLAMTGDYSDRMASEIFRFMQRIRGFAGYRSGQGEPYLDANFALHIVKDASPHDPVCTLLLTKKRGLFGRMKEYIETITYTEPVDESND